MLLSFCSHNIQLSPGSAVKSNNDALHVFTTIASAYLMEGMPKPKPVDETKINMSQVYNHVYHTVGHFSMKSSDLMRSYLCLCSIDQLLNACKPPDKSFSVS